MSNLNRRSFIKIGATAVASVGLIGGITKIRSPYINDVTIGLAPTTKRYIKGQPEIEEGEGEVWAILLDDSESLESKLYLDRIHPKVKRQISATDAGFWVMGASVLPSSTELNLISNSMDIEDGVVQYQASKLQDMKTADKDLLYHYELEKWTPKSLFTGAPNEVKVRWEEDASGK